MLDPASSLLYSEAASITARSPAYFEDACDAADAVPMVVTDPLSLKKVSTAAAWEHDVWEGAAGVAMCSCTWLSALIFRALPQRQPGSI